MIVVDILTRLGHPLGRRGRTTCPVHHGDNDQEFSYRDSVWHCFACGAGGTAFELGQRLGLIRERRTEKALRPIHGVEMLPPRERDAPTPPRPSVRLQRALYEAREARRDAAIRLHQEGFDLVRGGERLYALGLEEDGLDFVGDGYDLITVADAVLDCPCFQGGVR